jgi:hypothetical protein
MFRKTHGVAITGLIATIMLYGSAVVSNGCDINTGGAQIICPDHYTPDLPGCNPEPGSAEPQSSPCEGDCLACVNLEGTRSAK